MPLREFRQPQTSKIAAVLLTSLVPYILILILAYNLSFYSYWWVVALALPTHWFHARLFIIMHDCGHYSFFKSRALNNVFGHITALTYYIPFYMWRELHNKHHLYQGNLDKRNLSLDVWTLTVSEYQQASAFKKLLYRGYRHPSILLVFAPFILFAVIFRFPFEKFSRKALLNILILDLILGFFLYTFPQAFTAWICLQLPSLALSYIMASFLFYIQHQFEHSLWVREDQFSNELISLKGSSYYQLPAFFNWAYGNIVFHHLHHLDVKVPMYHLPEAQQKLQPSTQALSFRASLKALGLKLWDEKSSQMVAFKN